MDRKKVVKDVDDFLVNLDKVVRTRTGRSLADIGADFGSALASSLLRSFLTPKAEVPEYRELGVASDCSNAVLKAAFRARTRETHPDRPGGSEEAFKRVDTAYKGICEQRGIKP